MARVTGQPHPPFPEISFDALRDEWPSLNHRWKEWGLALTDTSAASGISYRDLKGRTWTQPAWQLVLHLANHGTHHRGQVSGFLRTMGHTPPVLDLVAYYRELQGVNV
jgi:uncharacterized damage-inducible protein DinB